MNLKMKSKKGQFFAIYLVLLTLFMCGMAVWIYSMQNKDLNKNSLASPISILELQDRQELFDLQERNIVIVSAKATGLTENGDVSAFKEKFLDNVMNSKNKYFKDFIFSSLAVDGKPKGAISVADDSAKKEFLKNTVYSFDIDKENKNLKVQRKSVGKTFLVRAPDKSVANFIIFVDYMYAKSYLINFDEINQEYGR